MRMSTKEKLLLILVLVVIVAGFAMTQFASYLAFVIQNCFAAILAIPRL